jgi:hypothetical protein
MVSINSYMFGSAVPSSGSLLKQVQHSNAGADCPCCHHCSTWYTSHVIFGGDPFRSCTSRQTLCTVQVTVNLYLQRQLWCHSMVDLCFVECICCWIYWIKGLCIWRRQIWSKEIKRAGQRTRSSQLCLDPWNSALNRGFVLKAVFIKIAVWGSKWSQANYRR